VTLAGMSAIPGVLFPDADYSDITTGSGNFASGKPRPGTMTVAAWWHSVATDGSSPQPGDGGTGGIEIRDARSGRLLERFPGYATAVTSDGMLAVLARPGVRKEVLFLTRDGPVVAVPKSLETGFWPYRLRPQFEFPDTRMEPR
jgi:hypothetical protein